MYVTFTDSQRITIAKLCEDLSRDLQCHVTADYGQTDDDQYHDAALCIESLPVGSWGTPGPLVSILTGPSIPGDFAVLAADGTPVGQDVPMPLAIQTARREAARQYRRMSNGAQHAE